MSCCWTTTQTGYRSDSSCTQRSIFTVFLGFSCVNIVNTFTYDFFFFFCIHIGSTENNNFSAFCQSCAENLVKHTDYLWVEQHSWCDSLLYFWLSGSFIFLKVSTVKMGCSWSILQQSSPKFNSAWNHCMNLPCLFSFEMNRFQSNIS